MTVLNRQFFEHLEKAHSGTVIFNDEVGSITLVGWRLEQLNHSSANEQKANDIENDANGTNVPGMP